MENQTGGCLAMVTKIDYEKEEIFLSDFIVDKKWWSRGVKRC